MDQILDYQLPVKEVKDFFGRTSLTAKIYSRIGAGRPQSVSIVGDFKIGKTSLVNFLISDEVMKKYLDKPASYIFISLSVSDRNIKTLEQFVKILSQQVAEKSGFPFDDSLSYYDWFKKAAETITHDGKKLIIFLDDFNLITQNDKFPLEFFSFLRSMANNYNVAYVTTSYHDLQKLCVSKDVEESPFFNIFTNMTLRAFAEDKVQDFIKRQCPDISTEKSNILVKYAGRFPYQLKLACNTLKKTEQNNSANFEEAFSSLFYEDIKDYFQELFSRFNVEHQKILQHFIATGRIPDQYSFLFNDLERKDYTYRSGKRAGLYSPSFERYIAERFNIKLEQNSKPSFFRKILNWFK
jgi:eukaryotic-like serine/threonine-protein kinase